MRNSKNVFNDHYFHHYHNVSHEQNGSNSSYLYLYITWQYALLCYHTTGVTWQGLLSFMISFMALYMCQVLHVVDFFGVPPEGNCAYVHWGSFTSNSKSVRRAIWFTWFSEPHECIQHLAVPGGHPSNYERGATLLNFSDRAQTVERTPYPV